MKQDYEKIQDSKSHPFDFDIEKTPNERPEENPENSKWANEASAEEPREDYLERERDQRERKPWER
jgi:hypothetical protein